MIHYLRHYSTIAQSVNVYINDYESDLDLSGIVGMVSKMLPILKRLYRVDL